MSYYQNEASADGHGHMLACCCSMRVRARVGARACVCVCVCVCVSSSPVTQECSILAWYAFCKTCEQLCVIDRPSAGAFSLSKLLLSCFFRLLFQHTNFDLQTLAYRRR